MKLDEYNLDNFFRDKLEGHSVPPPAGGWEIIRGGLNTIKREKRILLYRAVAVAAVVVIAFIGGWLLNNGRQEPVPQVAREQTERASSQKTVETILPESQTEKFIAEQHISIAETKVKKEGTPTPDELIQAEKSKFIFTENTESVIKRTKEPGFKLLAGFKALLENTDAEEKLHQKTGPTILSADGLSMEDRNLIAQNASDIAGKTTRQGNWELGFRLSPGYSSQSSNHSEEYEKNMTWADTDGSVDVNGGISVEYKAGKRWSLESGIYYAQNGQSSGNYIQTYASNITAEYADSRATGYFNTPVEVKQGIMAMNSAAGVIEFAKTPENTEVYAGLDAQSNYSNILLTSGEFSQVFDFIEVPLYVKYLLIDRKVDIELLGGFSANWVVGNNVYMAYEGTRENIGKTADISSLSYSGALGIGLAYELGKRFSVSVEPRFNYFLSSINKSEAVDYRPYRMGIYSGVNYRF